VTNSRVLGTVIKNSNTEICLAFYYLTFKIIKNAKKIKTREEIGLQRRKWLKSGVFRDSRKCVTKLRKNKKLESLSLLSSYICGEYQSF
jgi:hypothetical protein